MRMSTGGKPPRRQLRAATIEPVSEGEAEGAISSIEEWVCINCLAPGYELRYIVILWVWANILTSKMKMLLRMKIPLKSKFFYTEISNSRSYNIVSIENLYQLVVLVLVHEAEVVEEERRLLHLLGTMIYFKGKNVYWMIYRSTTRRKTSQTPKATPTSRRRKNIKSAEVIENSDIE